MIPSALVSITPIRVISLGSSQGELLEYRLPFESSLSSSRRVKGEGKTLKREIFNETIAVRTMLKPVEAGSDYIIIA